MGGSGDGTADRDVGQRGILGQCKSLAMQIFAQCRVSDSRLHGHALACCVQTNDIVQVCHSNQGAFGLCDSAKRMRGPQRFDETCVCCKDVFQRCGICGCCNRIVVRGQLDISCPVV